MPTNIDLLLLAERWERSARNRFLAAEQEQDEFGKRLIEHGALTYFCCAQELRGVLGVPLPPPSTTQKGS